jgi:aminopeptidase N
MKRVQQEDVTVELYHHPAHAANVDHMLEAATRSLDYFSREFGPYQYRTLRIVEVPSFLDAGALALAGVVYFVEDRGFLTDARDSTRFDIITRRMAHEVAHQWWGHQVAPATVEGVTMLVETLAKYSEQLVRGEAALEPLLHVDENRYREGAAEDLEEEPGLYRVADQSYIYYGKGGVVMHALRDSLGEVALNASLRRLVQAHGGPLAPPATTLDLLDYLHAATPAVQHAMIDRSLRAAGLEVTVTPARGPAAQ